MKKAARLKDLILKSIEVIATRNNETGKIVYEDFRPEALTPRRYAIFLEPKVAGNGLHVIQGAYADSKNVSASKTVMTIA